MEDKRWPRSVYRVGDEPDVRFSFANERTFLAWIRTGLAFLTAGVAIFALSGIQPALVAEVRIAAAILVLCGVACGVSSLWRWARAERALRAGRPLPSSVMTPILVVTLVVVAAIAMIILWP
ncbi:YidH family protein [Propionibacteriaceae bacterium Y1685]|uniref:YidH family protein n=1 Tax=Microlunatus sp. Y1700 TaxID=3418487 RepID=UPI003B7F78A3